MRYPWVESYFVSMFDVGPPSLAFIDNIIYYISTPDFVPYYVFICFASTCPFTVQVDIDPVLGLDVLSSLVDVSILTEKVVDVFESANVFD